MEFCHLWGSDIVAPAAPVVASLWAVHPYEHSGYPWGRYLPMGIHLRIRDLRKNTTPFFQRNYARNKFLMSVSRQSIIRPSSPVRKSLFNTERKKSACMIVSDELNQHSMERRDGIPAEKAFRTEALLAH